MRNVLCLLGALIIFISACGKVTAPLPPNEVVKLYLNELSILKDPIYKKKFVKNSGQAKRYVQAKENVENLIWISGSSRSDKFRKNMFTSAGLLFTSSSFEIKDERIEGEKAFVTVVFEKVGLMGRDLGKASEGSSNPILYELIKTNDGWKLKDIGGILAKRGF